MACVHSLAPELSQKTVLQEIQGLLEQFAAENDSALTSALYDVYNSVKNHSITDMRLAIGVVFAKVKSGENDMNVITRHMVLEHLFLVKKATVCPSKTFIEPPIGVRVNVLLHELDPERVMLVDIRDDDRKKLRCKNRDEATYSVQ